MSIVESIKTFIEPVKVANVVKVMSVEMWLVLNVALCFATTIFCFWLKETNVSIIVGAVLACFFIPRLLASILGVEK